MDKIVVKKLNYKVKNEAILKDINIDFKDNSYTAIIGPVGSGKTTLFNLIINGHPDIKIKGDVKYVVTDPNNQIVGKTVKEQLKFFLELENYRKRQITTRVKNIIKEFELDSILDKDPYILSEGEKQLVVLCSILVLDLDVLLLDNALCRLDKLNKDKVIKYLLKLKKKKVTIINFTSDTEEVVEADRIILLNEKIIFDKERQEALICEKEFNKNNLKLPFMVELSLKLKYYGLVKKIECDMEKMVGKIWS